MSTQVNGPLEAILDANPSVTAESLTDALSDYLETCISEVIRSGPLPRAHIPSAAEARLRTLRGRRHTKTRRQMRQRASAYESFIGELHSLRSQLNGHEEPGTTTMLPVQDLRTAREFSRDAPVTDVLDGGQVLDKDGSAGQLSGLRPLFEPYSGYLRRPGDLPRLRVAFEQQVQGLVTSDPVFEQIARTVESKMRAIALESQVSIELDFSSKSDPEYPTWKRYVVGINAALDFDTKMKFWSEIDAGVREALRQLRDRRPGDSARIEDIGRNLFIHMELT